MNSTLLDTRTAQLFERRAQHSMNQPAIEDDPRSHVVRSAYLSAYQQLARLSDCDKPRADSAQRV
jgi:hypothetical protein